MPSEPLKLRPLMDEGAYPLTGFVTSAKILLCKTGAISGKVNPGCRGKIL
jgi:hypothetical protein